MLRDEVILVDLNDNPMGIAKKIDAHKEPKLHRAFSVYLFNNKNELLIQKRATNKYHSGGLWTNACCSHPRYGETLLDSVKDRLLDEIGVDCEVRELFSFIYLNKFNDNLYEYEYDHVFIGKYDGQYSLNEEEASDAKWIKIEKLKNDLVMHPQQYTSWFIISAPKVIEYLEKNKKTD